MKNPCVVFLVALGLSQFIFAAEAPCGVEKEAQRIVALAKSELGVYSGVVTPFVNRILDSGGMEIASADASFDRLAVQAKKDGYNLGNIAAHLKKFNRLVAGCKEYPGYVKGRKAEKELAAKELELKKQARLAEMKRKQEAEKLAELERQKLEEERAAQEQIDLENERKRQEEERIAQLKAEFQNQIDQKIASLYEGYIVKIPTSLSGNSPTDPSYRGAVGLFSKLVISGDQYIITLKEMKNLNYQQINADLIFKVIKKRKKFDIALSSEDLLNVEIVARNEEEYFNR